MPYDFFSQANTTAKDSTANPSQLAAGTSLLLGITVAAVVFLGGWWWSSGSVTPPAQSSTTPLPPVPPVVPISKVELPQEYRVLADVLTHQIVPSPAEWEVVPKPAVLAELHRQLDALRNLSSSDQEIQSMAQRTHTALATFIKHFEEFQALPDPTSTSDLMLDSFVSGFVSGFTGDLELVKGSFERTAASDSRAAAKQRAAIALCHAEQQCVAIQLTLSRIAERFAAPVTAAGDRFKIDIDDPWGAHAPKKWICFHNGGDDLRDCTLQVQLTGQNGPPRSNVHFIKHWPANTWMYSLYQVGFQLPDGSYVDSQTVSSIQSAEVKLWSPEYSTQFRYDYQGAGRDEDVKRFGSALKIQGKYLPFKQGVLWNTQPGAELTLHGVEWLPPGKVTLTFRGNRRKEKAWIWDHSGWPNGEAKTFTTPEGALEFVPQEIDVELSFPDTATVFTERLKVSK
ncbi:hypothetical protein Plim_1082 [Planctopirus limnophila DSM 3776]|uniref:Uncharacterized protein n=1 Tax=Planctopirus limnophila (strain ATCC 43296 / DSM 3776 / IFAM 1008 / Mu 290) TaxID=521674 RepID=D5STT4_PLAL2|nr:hypothetical protein [Planctopirus limnophila]ADG66919.1 hypothetical protein Plim_1082 [Planctopirus limnophila DSM 3776]